jgi:ABC-type lipoprotein export system ATPase subunit/GNAT superfamily N-acetyltransferase
MRLTLIDPRVPIRTTLHTAWIADAFGLTEQPQEPCVARYLELPIAPGTIVAITGPSGSGKSSLLRAVTAELERGQAQVVWPETLTLPDRPLVDALGLPLDRATALLSSCGLAEPRLMVRRPTELSDGERWRFRLAWALAHEPQWIAVDEFTSPLDRTLAKVIAYNLRRQCQRTNVGVLIATCHDDVLADLAPDLHVRCDHGSEPCLWGRGESPPRIGDRLSSPSSNGEIPLFLPPPAISFAGDLRITRGSKADWPAFARWHYRSHRLGSVRWVTLLWHGAQRIGICVFTTAPLSLAARNRFFGRSGRWSRLTVRSLNRQLVSLSRVVLHPTYRGAGLAAAFVRASCQACPFPWIETLAQMGRVNPFFEKAGFVRVDVPTRRREDRDRHSAIYGTPASRIGRKRKRPLTAETHAKSNYAQPVYYVFDNRQAFDHHPIAGAGPAEPPATAIAQPALPTPTATQS